MIQRTAMDGFSFFLFELRLSKKKSIISVKLLDMVETHAQGGAPRLLCI